MFRVWNQLYPDKLYRHCDSLTEPKEPGIKKSISFNVCLAPLLIFPKSASDWPIAPSWRFLLQKFSASEAAVFRDRTQQGALSLIKLQHWVGRNLLCACYFFQIFVWNFSMLFCFTSTTLTHLPSHWFFHLMPTCSLYPTWCPKTWTRTSSN